MAKAKTSFERCGLGLQAFWLEHASQLELDPIDEFPRLLINPPAGLTIDAARIKTLCNQPWLTGRYGSAFDGGQYGEVVSFWTVGFASLADHVNVGSVLTLIFPGADHDPWLSWAGFELINAGLIFQLCEKFRVSCLANAGGEVARMTFGINKK